MTDLIRYEFSKLFCKKIVYISLTAFGILFSIMLYSWIFGNEWAVTQEGEQLYGNQAAAYNEEIIARYEGKLTDEKVRQILKEFPRINGKDTFDLSNSTYYPIARLFAKTDGTWNGKTVEEVFPQFGRPPLLGRSSRWEAFLYSLTYIFMIGGIITIIVISPVFSEEYSSGMDALILTSRFGKTRCVKAKLIASFLFSLIYTGVILVLAFLTFYLGKGFSGWDADIQLSEMMLYSRIQIPVKCWQAAAALAVLAVLSAMTLTSLVLISSLLSKTPYVSIIVAALIYVVPMLINPSGQTLKKLVLLAPANSIQVSAFLGQQGFWIAGINISMIKATVIVMGLAFITIWILGRKMFGRHQVI